jgi:hypothetical protein
LGQAQNSRSCFGIYVQALSGYALGQRFEVDRLRRATDILVVEQRADPNVPMPVVPDVNAAHECSAAAGIRL